MAGGWPDKVETETLIRFRKTYPVNAKNFLRNTRRAECPVFYGVFACCCSIFGLCLVDCPSVDLDRGRQYRSECSMISLIYRILQNQ